MMKLWKNPKIRQTASLCLVLVGAVLLTCLTVWAVYTAFTPVAAAAAVGGACGG